MGLHNGWQELIVLTLVAGLAGWNYWITVDSFVLPHKVSLYSVKPVLQHDRNLRGLGVTGAGLTADVFHSVVFGNTYKPSAVAGDFNLHYMTAIQASKYVLGCYGNNTLEDVGAYPGAPTWKHIVEDMWGTAPDSAKRNGTRLLDQWQAEAPASSSGRLGVCACIDDAVRDTTNHGLWLPAPAPGHAAYSMHGNLYDLAPKKGVGGIGDHYAAVVAFCQTSAAPIHVLAYEGTVGIPALLLAAQLCILLGLVHLVDLYVVRTARAPDATKAHAPDATKARAAPAFMKRRALKIVLALAVFALYLGLQGANTNHFSDTDPGQQGYRAASTTHKTWAAVNVLIVGGLLVVLVVEIVYEYLATIIFSPKHPHFHMHSTMSRVVDRVGADVPVIVGFGLLGLVVLLQADVSNSTTVLAAVLVLFVGGFVQHISNVVKILYEAVCARLSSEVVVGLTLHDEAAGDGDNAQVADILTKTNAGGGVAARGNKKIRGVLQFFGWTRLYLFVAVVWMGVCFFSCAKDTSMAYVLKGMLDGQLLYFTFAFIFSNIGFDTMYEIMPMSFESVHGDHLRIYFVGAYLAVFNINQILHVQSMKFKALA